jgi:hypothetical protein
LRGLQNRSKNTHPFYRGTYFAVVGRTATGSGNGTSSVAHGSAQIRLGQLTDFSFPYRFGGRFYLGVRAVITVAATATGDGTGSGTAVGEILPVRTATGNGVGSATTISIHVVVRTSTGTGQGTSATSSYVTAIRTSSGSGEGTSTTVGARVLFRTGTGVGDGTSTANWDKSHIFRVPTTSDYPFAERLSTEPSDRLFSFVPQGIRAYNLYKLTDGTYQITDPRRPERIVKVYLGGHDNFLDATEIAELTAAGYGSSIT